MVMDLNPIRLLMIDPALGGVFKVEIEGLLQAEFKECSGLDIEREVKTYREGGLNYYEHKFPGPVRYSNVKLKRGVTFTWEIWNWMQDGIFDGEVKRVNMSIMLANKLGVKVKHWNLENAWPVKYSGPSIEAGSNTTAIEELEIAHHGIELDKTSTGLPMF